MTLSSNRKEPVLNVNYYFVRRYPPPNSQRPDSSEFPINYYCNMWDSSRIDKTLVFYKDGDMTAVIFNLQIQTNC